jgi:hypothetical protein
MRISRYVTELALIQVMPDDGRLLANRHPGCPGSLHQADPADPGNPALGLISDRPRAAVSKKSDASSSPTTPALVPLRHQQPVF